MPRDTTSARFTARNVRAGLTRALLPVLAALLFSAGRVAATDLYYTDFENFTVGDDQWAGTDGWLGNNKGFGVHGIDYEIVPGLGKTAFLGFRQPASTFVAVLRPINVDPLTDGKPIVEFETLMGVQDSTNGHRDSFFFSFYNTNGNFLASVRFSNEPLTFGIWRLDGTSQYDTGVTFARNELHLLFSRIDFSSNSWSADLDGIPLFTNSVFNASGRSRTFGSVSAEWQLASSSTTNHGDNWLLVADWSVRALPQGAAFFNIQSLGVDAAASPTLSWNGEAGFDYQVEYLDALPTWQTNLPGSLFPSLPAASELFYTDLTLPLPTNRWYRVVRRVAP